MEGLLTLKARRGDQKGRYEMVEGGGIDRCILEIWCMALHVSHEKGEEKFIRMISPNFKICCQVLFYKDQSFQLNIETYLTLSHYHT